MKIILRILIDLLILFFVIEAWWFVALPLMLVAIWIFSLYIEVFLFGFIFDSLFGFLPSQGIWGYLGTIISATLFIGITFFGKFVRRRW